ncbi:Gfo/Idh/MocA family protein [Chitinasiproducens palmae]|uniref:Predicted dehydrogenase n=1 Tax=Chitinasiproducens palmae TaxID=1770053 RepID=A0A1H2PM22_9BURK|nr:Gfo/Idh/MocA family oxidoreductase [Chitinasiproducens palmae]SDV47610.1 Predicted dehydrogenase [Chitinasiproducens palmae]
MAGEARQVAQGGVNASKGRNVRYAVVGAGWIAQAAFMPAVAHTGNSRMTALVTGDVEKARVLSQRYGIEHVFGYDDYQAFLDAKVADAVYLALPNWMHHDYAIAALEAGLHVLLEKPMAVSETECEAIRAAARKSGAKLMIAYRLHFEPATLDAIARVRAGEIGEPRYFSAAFSQKVEAANHRARHGFWAGPVPDMGPYPLNAARSLFGAEPIEVSAVGVKRATLPFDFHDTVAVTLRFPGDRLAQFTVSYGADAAEHYRIVGASGDIFAQPAFGFGPGVALSLKVTRDGKTESVDFPETDQFGGELQYFSACVIDGRDPEPSGEEGLADVRVLAAIERALQTGQAQKLEPFHRRTGPNPAEARRLPQIDIPPLVDAAAPGGD